MPQIHHIAVNSYNQNHEDYNTFRFSFPEILIDSFLYEAGLAETKNGKIVYKNEMTILEVACGTGKLTGMLIKRGWGCSQEFPHNLLVVEPSKGMIESLQSNFPSLDPLCVKQSSSYDLKVSDHSVDAVLIAQAFHWFADEESVKEIHRVLKSLGVLGMIWNFDSSSVSQKVDPNIAVFLDAGSSYFNLINFEKQTDSVEAFDQYFNKQPWSEMVTLEAYKHDSNVPQYRKGEWKHVINNSKYFNPIYKELFAVYDKLITRDEVYKYWKTRSYITSMNESDGIEFKKSVEAIIAKFTDKDATPFAYSGDDRLLKPMGVHATLLRAKCV